MTAVRASRYKSVPVYFDRLKVKHLKTFFEFFFTKIVLLCVLLGGNFVISHIAMFFSLGKPK